jgi:hypothetical protein
MMGSVRPWDFFPDGAIGAGTTLAASPYLAAATVGSGGLPVNTIRNSRICFRRRILRQCCRPNLALSPFL